MQKIKAWSSGRTARVFISWAITAAAAVGEEVAEVPPPTRILMLCLAALTLAGQKHWTVSSRSGKERLRSFAPNAKVVLVGCKLDMRTDLATLRELSKQRLIPVTHEQGTVLYQAGGSCVLRGMLLPIFRAQCPGCLSCGHSGFN